MTLGLRRAALVVVSLGVVIGASSAVRSVAQSPAAATSYARLVEQLSEPGGNFDTDNLISNEKSYLHVIPALQQAGLKGGVYIGVGPDQNFSYIAHVHPATAYIIDIRRDNLLMHLLFKALFEVSHNRMEYLSLLTGRPVPDRLDSWRDAAIERIVAYLDGAKASPPGSSDERIHEAIRKFGVPVSAKDLQTIDRFHAAFEDEGLSLQFHSTGRPARPYYPTYRELLLETDRKGRKLSYVASEDDFQFVRSLEARDGVIPVVGDLGGTHALTAIGQLMTERGEKLSAFYVSNVEMYLFRDGAFTRYLDNLKRLPHTEHSLIIRSIFGGYSLADSVPGYYSTSTTEELNDLLAGFSNGKYRSYDDLLRR